MTPQVVRQRYAVALSRFSRVTIRRYYGTGSPRAYYEKACRGREVQYKPDEMVGPVVQGDWKIILLAEDLESGAITLPLRTTDKAIVRGKELTIAGIDDKKRRFGDVLCAYELQVRG
ncbi:hypothetical protein [Bradyrhizobium guangdongense]|uniref:hypothetical protein n=1 Tax=Bradyrhizobium guangdongense TaxID=1325090 RepID=UPI00131A2D0E|nr:hypothetical protein [Bradyrhizobium guangdongense]